MPSPGSSGCRIVYPGEFQHVEHAACRTGGGKFEWPGNRWILVEQPRQGRERPGCPRGLWHGGEPCGRRKRWMWLDAHAVGKLYASARLEALRAQWPDRRDGKFKRPPVVDPSDGLLPDLSRLHPLHQAIE